MESGRAADQPSAADINIQSNEEVGLMARVGNIGRRLSASKVVKVLFLLGLLVIIIVLVSSNLESALVRGKRLFKYRSNAGVKEISGLDEEGYRAYFYYKQMVEIAKDAVARGKKFYTE